MNINKVFIAGNITQEPELKYTPQGSAVMNISLANNRKYTAFGQQKEETTFVNVVLWEKKAELVAEYLKKGSPLLIEGRLQTSSWETKEGQKRSATKVVAEQIHFVGTRQQEAEE